MPTLHGRVTAYKNAAPGGAGSVEAEFFELTADPGKALNYNLSFVDYMGLPLEINGKGTNASCGLTACYAPLADLVKGCPTQLLDAANGKCMSMFSYCNNAAHATEAFCTSLDQPRPPTRSRTIRCARRAARSRRPARARRSSAAPPARSGAARPTAARRSTATPPTAPATTTRRTAPTTRRRRTTSTPPTRTPSAPTSTPSPTTTGTTRAATTPAPAAPAPTSRTAPAIRDPTSPRFAGRGTSSTSRRWIRPPAARGLRPPRGDRLARASRGAR